MKNTTLAGRAKALALLPATGRERRRIRLAAGATQNEIAADVGVHWTTVARWERNAQVPTGPNAERYALLLDQLERAAHAA